MDNIVVHYKDGSETIHPESARAILERVRGKEIFDIRFEGEPRKAMTPTVTKHAGMNENVVAIRMLKKGLSRQDVADVLGIDLKKVPDVKFNNPKEAPKASGAESASTGGKKEEPKEVTFEQMEQIVKLKGQKKGINAICNLTGCTKEQVELILTNIK